MAKVLIAVRLDANVVQAMDLRGSRSKVIRAALGSYLGGGIVQSKVDRYCGGSQTARPMPVEHDLVGSTPIPHPKVQAPACCQKNKGHHGFSRSDGYWCMECGKLYA